ncbi:MAG: hypothetical protein OIN89_04430 [Candidatus Methanoperedens sp.]|jgi:hypothetical protein|nr:hypothetical protein [Candidatus Methanoperedens sp.]PKL52920.1 MAG: hypothetical protein CVV36_09810 [Candidatus Methanoperedenaceae archaeon HGW-Methanoperedenaceae-1]
MSISEDSSKNQKEEGLQVPSISQQKPEQPRWLEMIIEGYPEQVGDILRTLPTMIGGNPKKIESETKIAMRTLAGFFIMMIVIVVLTAVLAYKGVISGDAVGFILGSAFGSMITFLYRYLIPAEPQ